MYIELHPRFADSEAGKKAQELTGACVHCGFCLATCPTYLDGRDERDSPRGRIHLIKQLLEDGEAGSATQTHLDRCLTCRNCETTCPSGMEYGKLLDIGKGLLEEEAPRPFTDRALRWSIRQVFSRPLLLSVMMVPGRIMRPLLPQFLREKIPPRQSRLALPTQQHERTMLVLEGCVQSAATPNTNAAARRVLNRLGITLISAPKAACCGALNYHLGAHEPGLDDMRRNIDAWWPHVEAGAEAIISSASGCGAMLIDYGSLLAKDPSYADKAQRISALCKDIGEVFLAQDLSQLSVNTDVGTIAVHTPCTLEHALQQPHLLSDILRSTGFTLTDTLPKTLCCGSAGTYSILEPAASGRIRDTALQALTAEQPDIIVTANVGCQLHLGSGSSTRVVHWIELLDSADP